jgi:uncharacterized FlaG/YvyC family protein
MRVDATSPAIDLSLNNGKDTPQVQVQSENRQVIQAARTVNASNSLGQNELTFYLDPSTRRAIIKIVNRETHEVVEQIPSEVVLRLAKTLKAPG